jgi:hypothetical protein
VSYLLYGLTNYQYGGQLVLTDNIKYLMGYENSYTLQKSELPVLEGGVNWKSNAAALFQLDNSDYFKYATSKDKHVIDTGILNLNEVGQIKYVFGDRRIKNKNVVYYNSTSKYIASLYYYPFNKEVQGSQSLVFQPNMPNAGLQTLEIFDLNLLQTITLNKLGA